MRILPLVSLLLLGAAACGGKAAAPAATPSNEAAAEPDETGWKDYESLGYGGAQYGGFGTGNAGFGYGGDGYSGVGYGGDGYGGEVLGTYTPPPPLPPDISGTWKSACTSNAIWTVVNTATDWDLKIESYSDATCTKR